MQLQIVYLAGIVVLGITAQWLAWRMRLPAILLLLAFGFAAGQTADPDELFGQDLLFPVVSLSVALIMFEGGLSLKIAELRDGGPVVARLVTVAVLVTWVFSGIAAWLLLGFEPQVAALLGAILVVSGPTVVVPLLRHMRPVRRIGSIAKWEGIVNDPIGAVLAVLVLEAILHGHGGGAAGSVVLGMLRTVMVSAVLGLLSAWLLVTTMQRYLVPDFLQNGVFLAAVVLLFVVSNLLQPESGLMTVTLLGVLLANQKSVDVSHVIHFKENLRVLLISCLFIVLAARVQVPELRAVGWPSLVFLASLVIVVRPLAVLCSTVGSDLSWRERALLGWLAPRGIVAAAVSSLFALEVAGLAESPTAGLSQETTAQAMQLAPVTFVVIVGTVTVYGITASPLARWLGLSRQNPQGILFAGASPWIQKIAAAVQDEGHEVILVDTNYQNIATARMAGLPTCYASIVSEYVVDELDLGGIGRMMAMTPNDNINALASVECGELFGRAEVYQLSPPATGGERRSPASTKQRGRILFGAEATYAQLARRFALGAQVKKTGITEDFSFDDFKALYGPSALVLFVVHGAGQLRVATTEDQRDPQAGEKLISLVDPIQDAVAGPADA